MEHVVLKRLQQSELGWFKACREQGLETGRQRGLNLDVDIVKKLFAPGERDSIQLQVNWHDGAKSVTELRPLKHQQKNWRITGSAVEGVRFGRVRKDDLILLRFAKQAGSRGDDGWTLTWDIVHQHDHTTASLFLTMREYLGAATCALLARLPAQELLRMASRRLVAFGGDENKRDFGGLVDEDWEKAFSWMAKHLDEKQVRRLLQSGSALSTEAVLDRLDKRGRPTSTAELVEVALRQHGAELLCDGARRILIANAWRKAGNPKVSLPGRWHRGGNAALGFVRTLGLPNVLAGSQTHRPEDFEDVEAFRPLGPLHSYQEDIARDMRAVLEGATWEDRRAIVWLPTGTGKTRVVVQTILEHAPLHAPRNCILWIADREELCEQAVETFRHVWMVRGRETRTVLEGGALSLRIIRLWGSREWQDPPTLPTVVVASIQTLATRIAHESFQEELAVLGERCAAVVLDEAHHAVSDSYVNVMTALGQGANQNYLRNNRKTSAPLIGLTATPARTSDDETEALSRRFAGRLLEPAPPYLRLAGFEEAGYLAKLDLKTVDTGYQVRLTAAEQSQFRLFQSVPATALKRTGENAGRTARIIKDLNARLDGLKSVLVFGCSVDHARTMAEVLTRLGRRAVALDGTTPRPVRWDVVSRFRSGAIQVLVNCDLLATGFDAPNVDAVVIARPVLSRVLLAQMVGRGLRGPRNGGTERCLVLDYQDSFAAHGDLERLREAFRKEFIALAGGRDASS
jgi:superfamily II DNA or RNA helicase